MGSMKGKQAKIDAAFGRLADMIQSGHLLAGTDPVGFLDTVAAELKDLRAKVDREKANKELESRWIFDSWTCRFCGGTFADRTLAIKHAIDCDDNEDVHSCATCASYEIGEDTRDGYRHICKGNPKRIDTWMKHCPEWIGA